MYFKPLVTLYTCMSKILNIEEKKQTIKQSIIKARLSVLQYFDFWSHPKNYPNLVTFYDMQGGKEFFF